MLSNDLLIVTGALVGSQRRDPQLHHVPGDEPQVPRRDRRRLRHDQRRGAGGDGEDQGEVVPIDASETAEL